MSFTSQRSKQNIPANTQSRSDYLREYFISSAVDRLEAIKDLFIMHLYEDVAAIPAPFDFRIFLNGDYNNANEDAGACVRKSFYAGKMFPRDIKDWTDSALKCFDQFLLVYIQDVRKERIKKTGSKLKERDVYDHLISSGGPDQEVGQAFTNIYQYRNEFQHVQYEETDGRRVIKRTSTKAFCLKKDFILGEFNRALCYFDMMSKSN